MSLHPQRSWTYQSVEPDAFVPTEHNLKRHASFPIPQLYPNGQPSGAPLLNPSRFQPHAFPSHPPAFNAPYFPNAAVPPNMGRPYGPIHPPAPTGPVQLPPSLGVGILPKLPKKPNPGGLGLYKIEDTPRPPLKKEEEIFSDDDTPTHNPMRRPHSSQVDGVPDEAMEKVQLQMADKLWLEEQERQKQQVEEERRRYERDLANGVSQRPLVPRSSANLTSESGHDMHRSQPRQYPSHTQQAPQPQHQHVSSRHPQAIASTTTSSLLPPNQPLQPRPISTEEREQAKRHALRVVMEEHMRAQEAARKEAELAAQRKADLEAEMQRQEKERKERVRLEAEAERLKEQREREKFEEECRRVSELEDVKMKQNAEQEAIQREYMRRAEAKRWQHKREKDERRQSRQRRRDYERRWQEDAWARSLASAPHMYSQARRYPAFPPYNGPEDRTALEQAVMHRSSGRRVQSENDPLEQHAHISEIDDSGASLKLDSEEEAQRMLAAWQRYDSLWNLFVKQPPPPNSIRFRDIPWPTIDTLPSSMTTSPRTVTTMLNPSTIAKFIFSPHHSHGKSSRQRIRSAFARFQPEKSAQWLTFVQESERPAVMMGVDIVFKTLVDLMEREAMSRSAIAGGEHN